MSFSRISESEVGNAVLEILASTKDGRASIAQLKSELPQRVNLSSQDRARSLTRRGEQLWEQQVRNLVSHRGTSGNLINDGLVEYEPRYLTITDRGRARVKQ